MPLPHPFERYDLDPRENAFLFDLDGTLLEIAPAPDAVRAPPRLIAALAALSRRADGAIAVVSGRRIAFLESILPGIDAPMAGVHGLELKLGGGHSAVLAEPGGGEGLVALRAALGPWLKARPGITVEDKGLAVSLHFRARPELEAEVEAFATAAATPASGLLIQRGKMVVELRPTGPSKGDAVAAIMALPAFVGRRPIYFGDDITDEHAFAAASALGGGGVFVGEQLRPTAAGAALAGPAAVLAFIETMARFDAALAEPAQGATRWR
jgi:trehalose 6-phosphate phosphatase